MCVENRVKSSLLLQLGLVLLILANVSSFVSRRIDRDIDFVTGLLFGVTFGLLLLSMLRRRDDSRMAPG